MMQTLLVTTAAVFSTTIVTAYTPTCAQLTYNASYDLTNATCAQPGFAPVCKAYDSAACCSALYTQLLTIDPGNVYPGFSYNQCPQNRALSKKCETFHQYQECSFGCDPNPRISSSYKQSYLDGSTTSQIPLCASYCDQWFDACADDYTCWTNWNVWPLDADGKYTCPLSDGAPACRTYRDTYTDARGLCTKLWGQTYNYSTDLGACISLGPSLTATAFPNVPSPPNLCPASTATAGIWWSRDGAIAGGVIGGAVLVGGVLLAHKLRAARAPIPAHTSTSALEIGKI